MRDWYEGELGKKLFFVGMPRSIDTSSPYDPRTAASGPFKPIFSFLDAQPAKSTLLISFGTVFYPTQEWQIETLYNTLLETKTPFIASKAPYLFQPMTSALEKRIQESGIGLVAEYLPQRELLRHPSLGTFLTHGGANSMFESILAGVPNVFWPFEADQPMHAAYMSQNVWYGGS